MSIVKESVKTVAKWTTKSEVAWKVLNGLIAVYKPAGNSTSQVRSTLIQHLCRDLYEMEGREPAPFVYIDGDTTKAMTVRVAPSFADHELVVGPRHQEQDLKVYPVNFLPRDVSGIQLYGINRGTGMAHRIKMNNATRFYKVKGLLGQATDNYFAGGKITEKSTFDHIRRHHVDMVCASSQSAHQKQMFDVCGVDIQSQAAYELAVQGLIRPANNKVPILYSIRCVDFKPPEFTLEIVCVNEDDLFLPSLVDSLGVRLRSSATCAQIQCVQYGVFNIGISLLKRDWQLENILANMRTVRHILKKHPKLFDQDDPIFREYLDEQCTPTTNI